jgi:tripartite-type tricarboxylate transporter receptor subunit TctC
MAGADDVRIPRRAAMLRLAGIAGSVLAARPASARDDACIEGRTVRWLVGYTAGGGYDAYARLLEPFLEKATRARIMIQNLPGAAGAVALRTLAAARPDGLTIAILDGPGALWSAAANEQPTPDLARDLTILGRVARLQHCLVTGPRSGAKTIEELVGLGRRRRLVFGATAPSSQNFVTCTVIARIFGLQVDYVVGYPGSRELTLALLRGDFDAMSLSIESGLDAIGPDRVIPLLLVTPERLPWPQLQAVARLTGDGGLAGRRPDLFASEPAEVLELGAAIHDYLAFGRIIAGPGGISVALRRCLEDALRAALHDPGLAAAAARAQRTLAVADAAEARADVDRARAAVTRILPISAAAARGAR